MPVLAEFLHSSLIQTIVQISGTQHPVYLVGGALRDYLMGRNSHDLDFITTGSAKQLAKKIANTLNGSFFMLDDDMDAARVILKPNAESETVLDFCRIRNNHLEADLFARDFTINAMAVLLWEDDHLIDPTHGLEDLKNKIIHACSPESFNQDALRILRALRFSLDFGFHIDAETKKQLKSAIPLLSEISPERRRDEIFRMLDGKKPDQAIRLMDQIGVLPFVLPELSVLKGVQQTAPHISEVWDHTLATVRATDNLLNILAAGYQEEKTSELVMGEATLLLGRYRDALRQYFSQRSSTGRSNRAILLLAAAYHDVGKPGAYQKNSDGKITFYGHEKTGKEIAIQRGQALCLSSDETKHLGVIIGHHMEIHFLAKEKKELTRRQIYRFFKRVGEEGLDICLLSLADCLATYGPTLPQNVWMTELQICRQLLEAWWEKPEEMVRPIRWYNGNEIQQLLNIQPGPNVGKALLALEEAQAEGLIGSRKEAAEYLHYWQRKSNQTARKDISMDQKQVTLHYEEQGTGIPLILVHGFPLDHTIWLPVANKLQKETRVIMPDLRGFGRSPVPSGTGSMRAMADDLLFLMDHLGIQKAMLAGHSMGGYVCLAFALAYPHRINGLALVASQASADKPEKRQARLVQAEEVQRKGIQTMAEAMALKLTNRPEIQTDLLKLMLQTDKKGWIAALHGMAEREDFSDRLPLIKVPTLVIAGMQDVLIPFEKAQEMADQLPSGWLEGIQNAGHMPMMEEPEGVAQALDELIQRLKDVNG
jgi:tRNA nucleotidyltransferase/poly(A) polymerase/pimeloyl-ACP methyl ester carboxylesterase